jgi:hypothetical protein
MFVTSFIFAKKLPTGQDTDVITELNIITSQEWFKIYTQIKSYVDMNHILNYVREGVNPETAVYNCNFFSTTLENAMNFQNAFQSNEFIDFYSRNGYNVTILAPVEIDMEDYDSQPIDYPVDGWVDELVSEETGRMWTVQYPVVE